MRRHDQPASLTPNLTLTEHGESEAFTNWSEGSFPGKRDQRIKKQTLEVHGFLLPLNLLTTIRAFSSKQFSTLIQLSLFFSVSLVILQTPIHLFLIFPFSSCFLHDIFSASLQIKMHRTSPSPLPPQGMPRSSSAAAINNIPKVRSQASSRIIRAQISSPIPMPDSLDKELSIRPQENGYARHMPPHVNLAEPSMDISRPSGEYARRRISSTPERSKSVLRTALSKIFGRKKVARPKTGLASAGSEDHRSNQHYSVSASITLL